MPDRLDLRLAHHDRLEAQRTDPAFLEAAVTAATTRWLVLGDGGVGERRGLPPELSAAQVEAAILLGRDETGDVVFAVDATRGRNADLLAHVGRVRPDRTAVLGHDAPGLLLHGLAMAQWHSRTRHCPRCGVALVAERGGHVLRCPDEGVEHFPRLEPAMIVAVVDHADRLLLGRQAAWGPTWFSTLAGFVEPGETIEQACRREVAEESGIVVDEVDYLGSQPWPFPASLMIGLQARATTTEIVLEDEIVEARWFTRADLRAAFDDGSVAVPPPASIAHHLVVDWFGGRVRDWTSR